MISPTGMKYKAFHFYVVGDLKQLCGIKTISCNEKKL